MAEPLAAFNLKRWIDEHRDLLKPPVGAEMIWRDSQFIVMIIGGPNARRDFHVDPSDEFFYQLEGDMVLEYIDGAGKRRRAPIRQGEVLLLPANTPHSPQRPAGSVGLVVERAAGAEEAHHAGRYREQGDASGTACSAGGASCSSSSCYQEFNASDALRTCKACGYVQPAPTGPRT